MDIASIILSSAVLNSLMYKSKGQLCPLLGSALPTSQSMYS